MNSLRNLPQIENEAEKKAAFAEALLRNPDNPFLAGKVVFPQDTAMALYACNNWVYDEIVADEQRKLVRKNGEERFLPTKADIAKRIKKVADDTRDQELALKALKLYCDVMGYIEKPGTTINNTNAVCNKIMVVPVHGDDVSWEDKLQLQQQNLIESSG